MLKRARQAFFIIASLTLMACTNQKPMPTVEYVELERFMGDWYVIANIPTYFERDAHNAIESYRLNDAGNIETTFTFNAGSIDGEFKTYTPRAFVKDKQSNALWGMQFVWPIRADYRIVYLNEDYSQVVIARKARDYVWIMSRTPQISDNDLARLRVFVTELGYDPSKLKLVPQHWAEG